MIEVGHIHTWPALGGLLIAATASHGRFSPDMDLYLHWHHRGVTHWWVWPVLAVSAAWVVGGWWWIPAALGVAWASHIVGDAVFGRVPMMPRPHGWRYWGLRLHTGGRCERWLAVPALIILGGWLAWHDALAALPLYTPGH